MAFPAVAARNSGQASANVTTTALPLPASIAVNNLLIAWIAKDGTGLPTWGSGLAGWNVLFVATDTGTAAIAGTFLYKIATGTESGNLGITIPSEAWAGNSARITGYDPNLPPAFATAGDGGTGTTNPNPPSLNPADWGTEDTLWLALAAGDCGTDSLITVAPASYSNSSLLRSTNATTTDRVVSGYAERQLNAASDDPGTFTRASEDWLAATVAIRPTPAAPNQPILRSAGFYSASGTTPTNAFTLDAGTDRRIMVSVSHETAGVTVTSMTYGGQAMALVTDGTDTAASTSTARVEWWTLRDADLPSNGSNNLVVTLSATAEAYINIMTVSNTDQSVNVADVVNANTAAATTVTTNVNVAAATSLVLSCCNVNNNVALTNYTVNGVRAMGRGSCGLPTGGAFIMNIANEPGTTSGSMAVVSTTTSTRHVMSSVVLAVPASGVVPAFVAFDNGGTPRSVAVAADVTLLVVAISNSNVDSAVRTVTYNGVTLSVGASGNDWTQIHYMLNPPVGSFTLAVSGANISTIMATTYSGVGSYVSGAQGSVFDHTFNPTAAALACFVMSSGGAATPLASTTERVDNSGDFYGDAILGAAGTLTVGVTTASAPDSSAALFLAPTGGSSTDVAGAVTTAAPTTSGALQTVANVSGAVTTAVPTSSGALQTPKNVTGAVTTATPTSSGALSTPKSISGAVTTTVPSSAGALSVPKNVAGAVTTSAATSAGSLDTPKSISGSVTSAAPTTAATLFVALPITGAVTSASPASSGALSVPKNVAGAVTSAVATSAGVVSTPKNVTAAVTTSVPISSAIISTPNSVAGSPTTATPVSSGAIQLVLNITSAVTTATAASSGALATPKNVSGSVTSAAPATAAALQVTATISGSVTTVSPATVGSVSVVDEENISGAVTTSAPTTSGSLTLAANVTGAVVSASPTSSGSLSVIVGIIGAVTTAAAISAGALQTPKNISSAAPTAAPSSLGSLNTPKNITGSVTTVAPSSIGALTVDNSLSVSGSVTSASPSTSGSIQTVVHVSSAVTSASPSTIGSLQVVRQISGTLTIAVPTSTGTLFVVRPISGTLTTIGPTTTAVISLGEQAIGDTQAQVGADASDVVVLDQGEKVVLAAQTGATVTIRLSITSVKVGNNG